MIDWYIQSLVLNAIQSTILLRRLPIHRPLPVYTISPAHSKAGQELMNLTDAKVEILREIQDEPLHGYALADRLGVRGSTIYEHLESLEENGYLESEEDGRRTVYHLTKKGELILEADDL